MASLNKISRSKLFEKLGAPLRNIRWSWGAVSESGNVYLAVWEDEFRRIKGKKAVWITYNEVFAGKPGKPGYRERLRHVDFIEGGAGCFCILCIAKDKHESPRRISNFNRKELLVGGKLIKHKGDYWLEDRGRKKIP